MRRQILYEGGRPSVEMEMNGNPALELVSTAPGNISAGPVSFTPKSTVSLREIDSLIIVKRLRMPGSAVVGPGRWSKSRARTTGQHLCFCDRGTIFCKTRHPIGRPFNFPSSLYPPARNWDQRNSCRATTYAQSVQHESASKVTAH